MSYVVFNVMFENIIIMAFLPFFDKSSCNTS